MSNKHTKICVTFATKLFRIRYGNYINLSKSVSYTMKNICCINGSWPAGANCNILKNESFQFLTIINRRENFKLFSTSNCLISINKCMLSIASRFIISTRLFSAISRNKYKPCINSNYITSAYSQTASNGKGGEVGSSFYYDRNFISATRAMKDFMLKPNHLLGLRVTTRRNPTIDSGPPLRVYWRKDVEAKSLEVWGSLDALEKAHRKASLDANDRRRQVFLLGMYQQYVEGKRREQREGKKTQTTNWPLGSRLPISATTQQDPRAGGGFVHVGSEGVIWSAIAINGVNFLAKLAVWLATGSHSIFSEAIHSAADTCNQIILAVGIKKSKAKPTEDYPYGYSNAQYVSSLISGVGIFFMGAGLSVYHGISGIIEPQFEIESFQFPLFILGCSLISESATLGLAIKCINKSAKDSDMGFLEFVVEGYDPCVNVVLLEDAAAVMGIVVAASAMMLSVHTGSHIPDAIGSIVIGSLLGIVASFMIYTNSAALVGRSIPEEKIQVINKLLEGDIMVRQILDVKGIDIGNGLVRYKAEIDVDGRELTRYYLQKQDNEALYAEFKALSSTAQLEYFMLKHGEGLVDCLGEQVDRIEKNIRRNHPEVRHVDLEVL